MPLRLSAAAMIVAWLSSIPVVVPSAVSAQTLQLAATRDNSIVMVDGEWRENAGSSGRIRIKGNQHVVAMSFDLAPLAGRRVKRAELVCHADAETLSGVTISTIAVPWDESTSNGLTAGIDGVDGWGYDGARFPAVCGGNAFTLVHAPSSVLEDGRYRWEVPGDMVHAMAIGAAYGLAIHEHDADYGRNPTIFSREQSGKAPLLVVEIDPTDEPEPTDATVLKVEPIDPFEGRLSLRAPEQGFAYEVLIDDHPLGRHELPWVEPGRVQTIRLRDLPERLRQPGPRRITVTTLDRIGRRVSTSAQVDAIVAPSSVDFPDVPAMPEAVTPLPDLAVIPLGDKYDRSGVAVGELPPEHRTHNRLFDGRTIRLTAAAGEVVGFQTLLRGQGDVTVDVAWDSRSWRIDRFLAVPVRTDEREIPDPLIPLPREIALSRETDRTIVVDLFVPFDAPSGSHAGRLTVSDGRVVPIELTVLPVRLPRQASFLCEMNGYGLPDHVDDYYALQQIAYDHRVHCNLLHYSHGTAAPGARKSNLDMRLASGRRMDNRRYDAIEPGAKQGWWEDFAEAFGPFLDGSCFRDGHRGPIAAPGFYLTFHESWPLNCRAYFNGDPDAYRAFVDTPEYAATYVDILADFTRLAEQRGWSEAGFQVYFNNKGSLDDPAKAPWILDEPAGFWDYRALQFYGELTDRGTRSASSVAIDYRIDISRPEFCRGQLSGRGDLWVVSSSAFRDYRRLVTDRMERDGLKVWVYGTSNPVDESNRQIQAWALDAWCGGASGLVPWQTIDKTGQAMTQADQLGLFIFDRDSEGRTVIRHSLRLKAYREAQQLIEYLILVRERHEWPPSRMRAFVAQYLPLSGEVRKVDEADAGTAAYDDASLRGIDELRQACIELLR